VEPRAGAHPIDPGLGVLQREGLGHVAAEGRQDRAHAKLAHPAQDPALQVPLLVDPGGGQGRTIALEIAHPLPGREGRAGEISRQVRLAQAGLAPKRPPDIFLALHGQRHVDPVDRHPVDLALPAPPAPPGRRVAKGAGVEVGAVRERALHPAGGCIGEARGQGDPVAFPAHVRGADLAQAGIGAAREGDGAVAADRELSGPAFGGIPGSGATRLKGQCDVPGAGSEEPPQYASRRSRVVGGGQDRRGGKQPRAEGPRERLTTRGRPGRDHRESRQGPTLSPARRRRLGRHAGSWCRRTCRTARRPPPRSHRPAARCRRGRRAAWPWPPSRSW
jgi:hypothetical protein